MAPSRISPKPKAEAAEHSPSFGRKLRRQLYRPATLVAAAVVVVVAMCLPVLKKHLPDLRRDPSYCLPAKKIEITQPPHWVPRNLVEQVIERADLPRDLPLLDENLTRDVSEAFALHPWVEEVVSVAKSFPPAVKVQLNYRRPVAMVQVKAGLYPVDGQGVLLPPHDFSPAAAKLYPLILDVVSTPQGPAGSEWGDPIVVEAAQLAAELAPVWKKLQLAAIVCPRPANAPADDSGYSLTTIGGSRVLWGGGPATDHPGELSTAQKIGRLTEYAAKFGGLDSPQGRYRIDIRHWRDIRREPLSADRDATDSLR
ncbi:MAG: cell division protein FtsQ/DivIB [Planctomycetaceae bacterium]